MSATSLSARSGVKIVEADIPDAAAKLSNAQLESLKLALSELETARKLLGPDKTGKS